MKKWRLKISWHTPFNNTGSQDWLTGFKVNLWWQSSEEVLSEQNVMTDWQNLKVMQGGAKVKQVAEIWQHIKKADSTLCLSSPTSLQVIQPKWHLFSEQWYVYSDSEQWQTKWYLSILELAYGISSDCSLRADHKVGDLIGYTRQNIPFQPAVLIWSFSDQQYISIRLLVIAS